jgi:hypothetical protein
MIPVWSIFCKIRIRRNGRHARLILDVSTGSAARAMRLKSIIGGRVERGTVVVEGAAMPSVMRKLEFPADIIDNVARVLELRGRRGMSLSPTQLQQRDQALEDLKEVVRAHLRTKKAPPPCNSG